MTLILLFKEHADKEYELEDWDEVLTTLEFYKHYSDIPHKVKIVTDKLSITFDIKSPIHFNTCLMMCREVYSKM